MLNPSVPVQREMVRSALSWWVDAGVDVTVDEMPAPWMARNKPKPVAATVVSQPAIMAETLVELTAQIVALPALDPLALPGRRIAASGNPQADLMVMIDMPEVDDAATGLLIGGEAGDLFGKMLAAIQLDRSQCYIAAFCPTRLPGGTIPADLIDQLSNFAQRHVTLAAPKKLWIMGMAASRALIGADAMFGQGRIRHVNYGDTMVEAVASFSPRMLLQQPKRKAAAWVDMQALMRGIDA
jgi:uracil-DNA glycosylase